MTGVAKVGTMPVLRTQAIPTWGQYVEISNAMEPGTWRLIPESGLQMSDHGHVPRG